ncbi:glutamate 5-kinase [Candidatus Methylacidithermus pantelleriae]|uniref:Glutamate 5-kinase n=1 Tax=Candidatus Methylacidithermus pantelleriae TaxID=2744239 RepID=A0A8J2FT17_9BACT|nr:glutamate 5-kinase [Candidatus Methylacidithermus pantelleriae]CAF0702278.1 Glutamate 5-kinase [Candidatus Methylacidithermus pantelleriae]
MRRTSSDQPRLPGKRWVLKFGTGILSDPQGRLDPGRIAELVAQVAELKQQGKEIVIVSSGAIGAGMYALGLSRRPKQMEELQACAAIGQPKLMRHYEEAFNRYGLHVAQLLLTYLDLDSRTLYGNAQRTIERLLALKIFVPIINENDVVSFEEIKFGDNDRLSAHVAIMAKADALVILSTVRGLWKGRDGRAGIVSRVEKIDARVRAWAGDSRSERSVGGMITKLEAAEIAGQAGIPTVVADGRAKNILIRLAQGEELGTLFAP